MSHNTLDIWRECGMRPRNPVSRLFGAASGSLRTPPCVWEHPLLSIIRAIALRRACFDLGCYARDIKYTMNRQQDGFVLWAMCRIMRKFALTFVCRILLFHVKQYKLRFFGALPANKKRTETSVAARERKAFLSIVTRIEVFCLRVWAICLV